MTHLFKSNIVQSNIQLSIVKLGIALVALGGVFGTALASDDATVTETRAIDGRVVRIKLDGVVDLKIVQGPQAQMVITGDKRWVTKTITEQRGDELLIETEGSKFKVNNKISTKIKSVTVQLTLPRLQEVNSESLGWTDIKGFSGEQLVISLDGAGSMKVDANYRVVKATLGGLGSMNIRGIDGDGIDLNLRGAGYVTLHGRSKWLKASLGGLGGLDAKQFKADTVTLDLSGLGNASVSARESANLDLSGLGSVTVYGNPVNRSVSVDGLGSVSWK
jgi:hypothetical protein